MPDHDILSDAEREALSAVMLEPDLPAQRVLIADDDKDARELLAEILGLDGIRCITAASGKAALELLESNKSIGLLITDLRMAPCSGLDLIRQVRESERAALPIIIISGDADVRDAMVRAFHGPSLRVYANDDMVGVEVGGAVKNVLAIATGLCDGLQLGLNARAALITRGLAEITRLGLALGARADTFMGLSGLGDLVLTATGDLSRNRKVGLLLAQGQTLQQAVDSLGHVAEGVYCARTVVQRARHLGVDMPIAEAVVALLDGALRPDEAVGRLMGRDPAAELPQA